MSESKLSESASDVVKESSVDLGESSKTLNSFENGPTMEVGRAQGRLRANVKPPNRFQPEEHVKRPQSDTSDEEEKSQPTNTEVPSNSAVPLSFSTNPSDNKIWRGSKVWTDEELEIFYDLLSEHGKNFEVVHKLLVERLQSVGKTSEKTISQVRCIYYRCWKRVCDLLQGDKIDELDVMKFTKQQELMAVINYGKVRQVYTDPDEFNKEGIQKFKKLMTAGTTHLLHKGKRLALKRSPSGALKKILEKQAREQSGVQHAIIPFCINVELTPLTMFAWRRVTCVGHNPRISIEIPANLKLETLEKFLQVKWRFLSDKLRTLATTGKASKEFPPFRANTQTSRSKSSDPMLKRTQFTFYIDPDVTVRRRIYMQQLDKGVKNFVCWFAVRIRRSGENLSGSRARSASKKRKKQPSVEPSYDVPPSPAAFEVVLPEEVNPPAPPIDPSPHAQPSTSKVSTSKPSTSKSSASKPSASSSSSMPPPQQPAPVSKRRSSKRREDFPLIGTDPLWARQKGHYGESEVVDLNRTFAEIYLTLGQPRSIKMCYDWKKPGKAEEKGNSSSDNGDSSSLSGNHLPPVLNALVRLGASMHDDIVARQSDQEEHLRVVGERERVEAQKDEVKAEWERIMAERRKIEEERRAEERRLVEERKKIEERKKVIEKERKDFEKAKVERAKQLRNRGVQCSMRNLNYTTGANKVKKTPDGFTIPPPLPPSRSAVTQPSARRHRQKLKVSQFEMNEEEFNLITTPSSLKRHNLYNVAKQNILKKLEGSQQQPVRIPAKADNVVGAVSKEQASVVPKPAEVGGSNHVSQPIVVAKETVPRHAPDSSTTVEGEQRNVALCPPQQPSTSACVPPSPQYSLSDLERVAGASGLMMVDENKMLPELSDLLPVNSNGSIGLDLYMATSEQSLPSKSQQPSLQANNTAMEEVEPISEQPPPSPMLISPWNTSMSPLRPGWPSPSSSVVSTPQRIPPNEDSQDSLIMALSQCHNRFVNNNNNLQSTPFSSPLRPDVLGGDISMSEESLDFVQRFQQMIEKSDSSQHNNSLPQ